MTKCEHLDIVNSLDMLKAIGCILILLIISVLVAGCTATNTNIFHLNDKQAGLSELAPIPPTYIKAEMAAPKTKLRRMLCGCFKVDIEATYAMELADLRVSVVVLPNDAGYALLFNDKPVPATIKDDNHVEFQLPEALLIGGGHASSGYLTIEKNGLGMGPFYHVYFLDDQDKSRSLGGASLIPQVPCLPVAEHANTATAQLKNTVKVSALSFPYIDERMVVKYCIETNRLIIAYAYLTKDWQMEILATPEGGYMLNFIVGEKTVPTKISEVSGKGTTIKFEFADDQFVKDYGFRIGMLVLEPEYNNLINFYLYYEGLGKSFVEGGQYEEFKYHSYGAFRPR